MKIIEDDVRWKGSARDGCCRKGYFKGKRARDCKWSARQVPEEIVRKVVNLKVNESREGRWEGRKGREEKK